MIKHTSYDTRNQLVDGARSMCVAIVGLWPDVERPHRPQLVTIQDANI